MPDENNKPVKRKKLHYFSLSTAQLAGCFPENYKIKIINETIDNVPYDIRYDAVFITSMGASLLRAFNIAKVFRSQKIPVIAGGTGVLIFQKECEGKFDSIAIGECETYIDRLIHDFENSRLQKIYKPEYTAGPLKIKHPRYDLLNHKKLKMFYPVQATRGCTNKCEFCYLTIMNNNYRKRPIKDILDDVKTIKSYGIKGILFTDENLICSREFSVKLLTALIPMKIKWIAHIDIRVCFDNGFIDLAKKSGCQSVTIGFETLNVTNISVMKKYVNKNRDYALAVKNLHNAGISVIGNFITGLDNDTKTTCGDIVSFSINNRIDFIVLSILSPIRGTPLYEKVVTENRLLGYEITDAGISRSMIKMPGLTREEIEDSYYNALDQLYSLNSIIKRTILNNSKIPYFSRIINLAVNLLMKRNIKNNNFIGII